MIYFFKKNNYIIKNPRGFVLPFTLFICAIMLLISTGISIILQKQIYFSQLARASQSAYYAADHAVACVLSVDETYVDVNGIGIFPHNPLAGFTNGEDTTLMVGTFDYTKDSRASQVPALTQLASTYQEIKCSQSTMFDTGASFMISPTVFSRTIPDPILGLPTTIEEYGRTSTFKMKMDLGGGTLRCAKVTVNKTDSYRQIIAQGYSSCNSNGTISNTAIERAVIDTTIVH